MGRPGGRPGVLRGVGKSVGKADVVRNATRCGLVTVLPQRDSGEVKIMRRNHRGNYLNIHWGGRGANAANVA